MRWKIVLFFGIWAWTVLFADKWTFYQCLDGLPSDTVTSIVIDPFGFKWAGTIRGLSRFNGTQWENVSHLGQTPIYDLTIEKGFPSRLWIGTEAGVGVLSISGETWVFEALLTTETQFLVSNRIFAVIVDSGHTKWFGTDKGISLLSSLGWNSVPQKHLSSLWVLSFGYDKNTGWNYVGTKGGGVSRVRIDSLDGITSASPYDYTWASLPSDTVCAVWIDSDGSQWFGTDQGLAYHQGTNTKLNWFFFNKDSGMASDFVQTIQRDHQGFLWVGTQKGLSFYNGFRWQNLDLECGVNAIAEDQDGSLWFGTDQGVMHYQRETALHWKENRESFQCVVHAAFPNPFNPKTEIWMVLSQSAKVRGEVFDLLGKKIRTLIEKECSPGIHRVIWDGKDDMGFETPSGLYMAVFIVHGHTFQKFTQKLVRSK